MNASSHLQLADFISLGAIRARGFGLGKGPIIWPKGYSVPSFFCLHWSKISTSLLLARSLRMAEATV